MVSGPRRGSGSEMVQGKGKGKEWRCGRRCGCGCGSHQCAADAVLVLVIVGGVDVREAKFEPEAHHTLGERRVVLPGT